MATNGLQDSVLIVQEKRCERAVGWKVCLKIFEISAVGEKFRNFENGRGAEPGRRYGGSKGGMGAAGCCQEVYPGIKFSNSVENGVRNSILYYPHLQY
jgi:hypothetical protein